MAGPAHTLRLLHFVASPATISRRFPLSASDMRAIAVPLLIFLLGGCQTQGDQQPASANAGSTNLADEWDPTEGLDSIDLALARIALGDPEVTDVAPSQTVANGGGVPRTEPRAPVAAQPESSRSEATGSTPVEVAPTPRQAAPAPAANPEELSGAWTLCNTLERTNVDRYRGMQLCFALDLTQSGDRVTGFGVKFEEDGQLLSGRPRTPVSLNGTIRGDLLTITITEHGDQRLSRGSAMFERDGEGRWVGMFETDATGSSGRSVMSR